MAMEISGAKSSGGSSDNGANRGTEIASVAYMKMLLALSEGEIDGGFTGEDIYLNGTPLIDSKGAENFPGVTWDWRSGTLDQDYIHGFPAVENELNVGYELKYGTPWVKAINNAQLSAVRLRIKFPNGVYAMRDSGGKNGYRIEYAVDISTDGSTYVEYGRDAADGIANSGYERSYRIDLPAATSGWQIRVRRLTENTTDGRHADTMNIESMTEIVDAKLRYPHTALLFVQFDAKLFDGQTPTVTVKAKGLLVRVPANYDPINRTYSGTWDGTFKFAWTNNPAWVFYDMVTQNRYGLGQRISLDQVDKWTLYQIAQYCDAQVSDGAGGKEPRFLCDLYMSQRTDAWTVLNDIAAIFRGMISWSGNLMTVDADMPRELDPDFVFNRANVVGSFNFSSTSERSNYSSAIVTWSNPANGYNDDQASVMVQDLAARFGFNTYEMTATGCTRESEAQRRGLWAIETNRDDNVVEFPTGNEGRIPRVGKIIGINDAPLAGRQNGGRVSAAAGTKITLDRITTAKAGDRLIVNLPSGKAEGRNVVSVSGRGITVASPYSETPAAEAGWVLDQADLAIQQFRVKRTAINDDGTVTISGLPYNPNKFARVDDGAVIEDRPVTVVPPRGQGMPENITITSSYRVEQGIGITTMEVTWDSVTNAVAYEAQWRQNNGDWINVARTGNTRFEVDGIYAGRYTVRVRAFNASDIASMWGTSVETELTGKTGKPPMPINLMATPEVFGISLSWEFPAGAQDTLKTEVHYSKTHTGDTPLLLSDVPYPSKTYQQMGLLAGQEFWYRARLVDRIGNAGDWTEWVYGQSSIDVEWIADAVKKELEQTEAFREIDKDISEANDKLHALAEGLMSASLAGDATQRRLEETKGELSASVTEVRQAVVEEGEARALAFTQLKSATEETNATLTQLSQTVANADKALAEQVSGLTSRVGGNEAALQVRGQTIFEKNGTGSATFSVGTGVTVNGVYKSAGLSVSAEVAANGTAKTYILLSADKVAIMNPANGAYSLPFFVQGGQTFIQSAFIGDGTITNAKIGSYIQSNNYVAGNTGWKMDKNGTLENYGSDSSGAMKQTNTTISVRDSTGRLRVQVGKITGTW